MSHNDAEMPGDGQFRAVPRCLGAFRLFGRSFRVAAFHRHQLGHATPAVFIGAADCGEVATYQVHCEPRPHDLRADTHFVDAVVLHALMGDVPVVHDGCPDSWDFVGRDRGTDSGAAYQDGAVSLARHHVGADLTGDVGKIDRGFVVATMVRDLVAQFLTDVDDRRFQREPAMIGGVSDIVSAKAW